MVMGTHCQLQDVISLYTQISCMLLLTHEPIYARSSFPVVPLHCKLDANVE